MFGERSDAATTRRHPLVDGSVIVRNSAIVTSGQNPRALSVTGGNGQNRIVHSQVVGAVSGSALCFGSYGASYTALSSTCQ